MPYTVQDIIDTILKTVPGAPVADTVDTLKSGDPSTPVTGIATTFIATLDVMQRAADLGANLIITHEPTYFNHRDEVDWLSGDPVYTAKRDFLAAHNITVWRFHDHWHMHQPDGIYTGLVNALGWQAYQAGEHGEIFHLPATTLAALTGELKNKLGLKAVRTIGAGDLPIRSALVLVGSLPGDWQLNALRQSGADVLIVGETVEWQVYEYVRDASAAGRPTGLIQLGHEVSEEPGMAYLADWLRERLPGLPITHVPAGDPLVIR